MKAGPADPRDELAAEVRRACDEALARLLGSGRVVELEDGRLVAADTLARLRRRAAAPARHPRLESQTRRKLAFSKRPCR